MTFVSQGITIWSGMTNHPPLTELRAAIVEAGYRFDRFAQLVGERPDYFNHQLAGRKRARPTLFRRAAEVLRCSEFTLRPAVLVEEDAAA